jgi:NAD(P)-dependent dehydrogenase (short-subunit alcohol dehydrogenase family)
MDMPPGSPSGSPLPVAGRARFAGRVALVTGGAGDIGVAVARVLATEGATVALLDVDEARLREAAGGLAEAGTVVVVPCDVTREDQVDDAVASVATSLGRLDVVFNNAGLQGRFAPIDRYPADDFRRVLDVNVVGVFHVLRAAVPHLRATRGAIVNTASHAGVVGPPNMAAYAASKFAVVGLTQTAAKDLAPAGIRVNAISPALIGPGTMWTRQVELQAATGTQYFDAAPDAVADAMVRSVPMRRLGSLDEVAGAVAFLLSDDASYITGVNLEITGGI